MTVDESDEGPDWQPDGSVGYVFLDDSSDARLVPVHRMDNPWSVDHLSTTSDAERDLLISHGWIYEGVAGYVYDPGCN